MDETTRNLIQDVLLIAVGTGGVLLHRWAQKPARKAAEDTKKEVETIRSFIGPPEDGEPIYRRIEALHDDVKDGFKQLNSWGEGVDRQIGEMRVDIGRLQRPRANGNGKGKSKR